MTRSKRIYVLDTNVLMHDPTALFKFEEHDVYLPMQVMEELDNGKKGTSEASRNARQVSRFLNELVQESGLDTLDANLALGHQGDARQYAICQPMLDFLGVKAVRVLTNNPDKLDALSPWVNVVGRVPFWGEQMADNAAYLATKQARMGHLPG